MSDYDAAFARLKATEREIQAKREALRDRLQLEAPDLLAFMAEAKKELGTSLVKMSINDEMVYDKGRVL